jgi:uncharacterized protein YyaL (SSP411 family)
MANRLAEATSPYLLQHKGNPVHWQEWSSQALAEAQQRDLPILLSIGYAACHWCHVMAHESFESERIAAQMNRSFICIKVDREERPDLDAIYQQALALLGQQGGWPLTMFLMPSGEPFWGGTYFPPAPRYGRPGFPQILDQISTLWHEDRSKLESNRAALREALERGAQPEPGQPPERAAALAAARRLAEHFDTVNGGFAGAPKFPQTPMLTLLWQAGLADHDLELTGAVLHTLERICQGGIYDHLGGGFARYSVDARWLVPHFEKMLYDNAQLLPLLADAWAASGSELYRVRARETVEWLRREMQVEAAFASSLDADSEGEEGKFYVWTADEIDRLLGQEAGLFRAAYGVEDGGNWEGVNVLNRLHAQGLPSPGEEQALARCRSLLLQARERRPKPGRDDKVLADWNGLMIAGLSHAAWRLDEPVWQEMAEQAFAWILERMGEGDGLSHSWREGRRLGTAFLDDYAQMSLAAITLFEHTGNASFLDRAERWVALLDSSYRAESGAYFTSPSDATDLILRPMTASDGPVPSGNAALLHGLARLYVLTGDERYRERADGILGAFAGEVRRNPYGFTAVLSGLLLLAAPVQAVLVGRSGREALIDALARTPVANLVIYPVPEGGALPDAHPAAGKPMVGGASTAYICVGSACRPPVNTAPDLAMELTTLPPVL